MERQPEAEEQDILNLMTCARDCHIQHFSSDSSDIVAILAMFARCSHKLSPEILYIYSVKTALLRKKYDAFFIVPLSMQVGGVNDGTVPFLFVINPHRSALL